MLTRLGAGLLGLPPGPPIDSLAFARTRAAPATVPGCGPAAAHLAGSGHPGRQCAPLVQHPCLARGGIHSGGAVGGAVAQRPACGQRGTARPVRGRHPSRRAVQCAGWAHPLPAAALGTSRDGRSFPRPGGARCAAQPLSLELRGSYGRGRPGGGVALQWERPRPLVCAQPESPQCGSDEGTVPGNSGGVARAHECDGQLAARVPRD
mmetsp:Transcript_27791/g.89809  ORF Transcript_27791/g.89809 Transcript_27791/m.89809 type:complete len:207 (+) Transcript_27791:1061-1681(+)